MKYTVEVEREDINVVINDGKGEPFISFSVLADDTGVYDATVTCQDGTDLLIDMQFECASDLKDFVADAIERLKIFEKEALKYLKPEKKPVAKKKK